MCASKESADKQDKRLGPRARPILKQLGRPIGHTWQPSSTPVEWRPTNERQYSPESVLLVLGHLGWRPCCSIEPPLGCLNNSLASFDASQLVTNHRPRPVLKLISGERSSITTTTKTMLPPLLLPPSALATRRRTRTLTETQQRQQPTSTTTCGLRPSTKFVPSNSAILPGKC